MAPPSGPGEPGNPHDALFRKVFERPEHAAAELRAVLPREVLARTNLSTLELVSGTFVDEELRQSQSDLLFSVELGKRPALLYVLFEHQSSVDVLMPFRVLKYVVRVLDRHIAGAGLQPLPLPIVVPVVLHHSASWASLMTALIEAESGQEALGTLFRYLSVVTDRLSHEAVALALAPAPSSAKEKLMAEIQNEWTIREARGRVAGTRRSLLQLLSLKFGELGRADLERIESASEEQLVRWTPRVLSATTLTEVLAD